MARHFVCINIIFSHLEFKFFCDIIIKRQNCNNFIISIDKGKFWVYNYTNILGWYVKRFVKGREHNDLYK